MKITCLSDTHSQGRSISVPHGDVLVHAGDHTYRGGLEELEASFAWLASLPHPHKLLIAGNHDWYLDGNAPAKFRGWHVRPRLATRNDLEARKAELLAKYPTLTYLEDSSVTIDGIKFYGSPWQPYFWGWAFNFPAHDGAAAARATWARIPDDTDVLITHGPPRGIQDRNRFDHGPENDRAGCPELLGRITNLKLMAHIYGHIHGGRGVEVVSLREHWTTFFINASSCTESYEPINAPIELDISSSERRITWAK